MTYQLVSLGTVINVLFSKAEVKVDENGMITEIVAEMRMTFPDMPGENGSVTITMRLYDYGTTFVDKSLAPDQIIQVG